MTSDPPSPRAVSDEWLTKSDGLGGPELIHATWESLRDAIFVVNLPDREIELCNRGAAEMFGYDRDRLVGANTEFLHVDREAYEQFVDELLEDLRDRDVSRGQHRLRRADGTTFPTEHVVAVVSRDGEGRPRWVVSVVRDIGDRVRDRGNLELVNDLHTAVTEAADYEEALEQALGGLGRHIGWAYAEAWTPESYDDAGDLVIQATWDGFEESARGTPEGFEAFLERTAEVRFARGEGLPGRAWAREETIRSPAIANVDWYQRADAARAVGFQGAMAVPVVRDGEPLAVLVWYTTEKIDEDSTPLELAETVTQTLGTFLNRRRIEQDLREERDRFQTVARNVAEVFWMSSADKSKMHYVNPAYERVWGRPREELLDNPRVWLEYVHDEDRDRVREATERQKEGDFDETYRIVRPDGEIRWIRDRAYPIRRQGEVVRIVGVAQDITKRKRAERQLQSSERKFSTAFQMNPLAMSIVDWETGRFVDVNEGFCDLAGRDRDELVGAPTERFELWTRESDRKEFLRGLANEGRIREYETEFRTADGDIRDVLASAQMIEVDGDRCVLSALQDITERRRFEQELEHQSLHDVLTGLPNRRLFRDRVEHALTRAEGSDDRVVVMFVDIARLRMVNSSLGHTAGDQLLEVIAERLVAKVSNDVTVARYGGDEFALLFEEIEDPEELRRRSESWFNQLTEPCEIQGTTVHPRLKVGIAASGPGLRNAEDLVRYAAISVPDGEAEDHTPVRLHESEDDAAAVERLQRENALRRAVEREEFTVHYQPVFDLPNFRVGGVEGLVRWEAPDRGQISPGEFIPLAEETGLIVPIGYQVLEMVCRDAADWYDRYPILRDEEPLFVSVNLSVRQYREPDLVDRILEIVEKSGFPLERLILEITESILVTGHGKLEELREKGARISIDDFGTGYSSLQYLRRLEADEIKIDRCFLDEMENDDRDRALVDSMLEIGEKFGLEVVAEGVETERQRDLLVGMGAKLAQGFYFARPMPPEQLEAEYLDDIG